MLMLLDFMSRGKTTLINTSEVFWLFTVSVMFVDIQQTLGLNPDYPVTNRTISILIFDTLGYTSWSKFK